MPGSTSPFSETARRFLAHLFAMWPSGRPPSLDRQLRVQDWREGRRQVAMSRGLVSSRFPYLPIHVEVRHGSHDLEALLDTGFDGDVLKEQGDRLHAQARLLRP